MLLTRRLALSLRLSPFYSLVLRGFIPSIPVPLPFLSSSSLRLSSPAHHIADSPLPHSTDAAPPSQDTLAHFMLVQSRACIAGSPVRARSSFSLFSSFIPFVPVVPFSCFVFIAEYSHRLRSLPSFYFPFPFELPTPLASWFTCSGCVRGLDARCGTSTGSLDEYPDCGGGIRSRSLRFFRFKLAWGCSFVSISFQLQRASTSSALHVAMLCVPAVVVVLDERKRDSRLLRCVVGLGARRSLRFISSSSSSLAPSSRPSHPSFVSCSLSHLSFISFRFPLFHFHNRSFVPTSLPFYLAFAFAFVVCIRFHPFAFPNPACSCSYTYAVTPVFAFAFHFASSLLTFVVADLWCSFVSLLDLGMRLVDDEEEGVCVCFNENAGWERGTQG